MAASMHDTFQSASAYGWQLPEKIPLDWAELQTSIGNHIKSLNFGYRTQLRSAKVNYINAMASFGGPHTLCYTQQGHKKELTAFYILIAVGGRPQYLDIPGAREYCITSDDIFWRQAPPGRTLVVGASYVALECAGFLTHLGFDTTVMVRSILLRGFDQEMAAKIGAHMERTGTRFIHRAIPTKVEKLPNGKLQVTAQQIDNPQPIVEQYDTVLLAIGRVANNAKLHLEKAGVAVDPRTGKIPCKREQTNVPHIFCVGDALLGAPELTPTAILAGKIVSRRLFAGSKEFMRYEHIPTTVFTPLEYGSIGLPEEAATELFGADNVEVFFSSFQPLEWSTVPRLSEEANTCHAKLICNKADHMRIIGFHYLGPNAAEVTNGWALALRLGATKADLDGVVGIHPSCAEIFNGLTITKSSGKSAPKTGC